ncbi:MAG: ScpA family protein [Candidatus Andersenbacteria bacterium]
MSAPLPTIKLENFEGPFDLLLELARKKKLDLTEISLREITEDFLQYVQSNNIPSGLQGDFLVVAATLLLLKVRQLAPSLTPEEEEEVYDLTERVKLYQLYRERATWLAARWDTRPLFPAAFWGTTQTPVQTQGMPVITIEDIRAAVERASRKLPKPLRPQAHLVRRGRSLAECLSLFKERLQRVRKFTFQEAVHGASRQDTAVSFLAVLEMARKREVELRQETAFTTLLIEKI